MMDLQTLTRVNREATYEAARRSVKPALWHGEREHYRIPFVGAREVTGWRRTDREPLFVDTSGFGADNEPALSPDRLFAALRLGKAYGLIEQGQFQGYLAEFEPDNTPRKHTLGVRIAAQLDGVDYVGKPKRVANNTVRYERPDGSTAWRLHLTDVVVKHPDGTYALNSGGWETVTTKDRINTFAPVRLYQRKHQWWLADGVPFKDGMIVNSSGSPVN